MKKISLCLCGLLLVIAGCSQTTAPKNKAVVGGACEGCEAVYESELPFPMLPSNDTLSDFYKAGPKLHVYGTVFEADGKTPSQGVVLYFYHTNQAGIYPTSGTETGWARRHGNLRGWLQTDAQGRYSFYTLRPAAYPGRTAPQHIHMTVKELRRNPYWIDELVFDDDELLSADDRTRFQNRGGTGLVKPVVNGAISEVRRDIVLGKNIPDYR